MPNTQNYSFSFESPGSLPGTTLTGGPEGGNAVLARQVDTALAAVETKADVNTANITANADDISDVASDLSTFEGRFQSGTVLFSFTSQNSDTIIVPFPSAYSSTPVVMANIDIGAGETARWMPRAISISTTQFTLFVFGTDDNGAETQTWSNVPVSWLAFGA